MREFKAVERCDRCGAQALHAASQNGFEELLFCNHHFNKHELALLADNWTVESNLSPIEPVPASTY